ncbi:MAG: hypothetical protein BWZ10_01729 [candidate division BRC1 bacterium ADurb.BinA364]|nr:MAG: hypothetical protein BWZ10_01729 [candidate division BRC1 bacterium ADurb.BinA364]
MFHGKEDTTVPYANAEAFRDGMRALGNRCELAGYEGEKHGFFNFKSNAKAFKDTLGKADEFLASLGWIEGPQTVEAFFAE